MDNITKKQSSLASALAPQQDQLGTGELYTHEKVKDLSEQRNLSAINKIRTDSKGMTLDKFFVSGNVTLRKDIAKTQSKNPKMVVPQKLMSVRKLIYSYENDIDEQLSKLFKKHFYVGMVSPD